jgi:hypothetical protein
MKANCIDRHSKRKEESKGKDTPQNEKNEMKRRKTKSDTTSQQADSWTYFQSKR